MSGRVDARQWVLAASQSLGGACTFASTLLDLVQEAKQLPLEFEVVSWLSAVTKPSDQLDELAERRLLCRMDQDGIQAKP